MKQWFMLLSVFVGWGCSPQNTDQIPEQFRDLENLTVYSADAKPEKTISFQEDAVYGLSEEVLIGRIQDIAVDSSGRVFIADIQKQSIYVFEPDGGLITQLGREGRGPGCTISIKRWVINSHRFSRI